MPTHHDFHIPTYPALLPEYSEFMENLRRSTLSFLGGLRGGPKQYTVVELTQLLSDIITADVLHQIRAFEFEQSQTRIIEINGRKMRFQSTPGATRRRTDTMENILFNEFVQYLDYVEKGLEQYCGDSGRNVSWRYRNVGSSVSIDGIASALRNEYAGQRKISYQLHEYNIRGSTPAGTTDNIRRRLEGIVLRDSRVMKQRDQFTVKGPHQLGTVKDGLIVLDSTRHTFYTQDLQYTPPPAKRKKFSRRPPTTQPVPIPFELHERVKSTGDVIVRGVALNPGQVGGFTDARKIARYLTQHQEGTPGAMDFKEPWYFDRLGGRTQAPYELQRVIKFPYLHAITKEMGLNPDFWYGRLRAHDFVSSEEARRQMLGNPALQPELEEFTQRLAGFLIHERSERGTRERLPDHYEEHIPLFITLADGRTTVMNKVRQWYSPTSFYANTTRKGISHPDYRGHQISDIVKEQPPQTVAVIGIIAGVAPGYEGCGLVEPAQIPLLRASYEAAVRRSERSR